MQRLEGRLRTLEKERIVNKIDKNTYKVDIEKFNKMIEERAKQKIEKNKLIETKKELKNELNQIRNKIRDKYNIANSNLNKLKSKFTSNQTKMKASIELKKTFNEINQMKIEETKIKAKLIDQNLLTYGKIDPYKGADYLIKNTTLSIQKIREITEFQIKRLEQLERRGFVEKRENSYILKNKEEFKKYINSQKANKDRERIAKSKATSKAIRTKVNNFVKKNLKIRPIKDFKSSYYHLKKAFGRTIGDQMLAFAVALGYSIAKNSTKLAIKTTLSVIRTLAKAANKTIEHAKNKNFEKKLKEQNKYKDKNKLKNKSKSKKESKFKKEHKSKEDKSNLENKTKIRENKLEDKNKLENKSKDKEENKLKDNKLEDKNKNKTNEKEEDKSKDKDKLENENKSKDKEENEFRDEKEKSNEEKDDKDKLKDEDKEENRDFENEVEKNKDDGH